MGLSESQIFKIQSIYYLAFCLFELPTGWLADRIGHRKVMILGAFSLILANIFPFFISNYFGFLIHFLLIAWARSLVSGSSSAYLYEYLRKNNLQDQYKSIEGRARSLSLVARVVAWPFVSMMMAVHLFLPYILSALNSLIAFGAAFFLPEEFSRKEKKSSSLIKEMFQSLLGSPLLLGLIIQGAGIFILQRIALVQLYQPLLKEKGVLIGYFGILMSAMTVAEALGSSLATKVKNYLSDYKAVFLLTIFLCASTYLLGSGGKMVIMGAFLIFSFICGLAFPIQKQLMNDFIPSADLRASFLSLESLLDRSLCSLLVLFFAPQIEQGEIGDIFHTAALLLGGLTCLVFPFLLRHNGILQSRIDS